MIVKESEAKKLWCPWFRDNHGSNEDSFCITKECMAWRWVVEGSRETYDKIKTPLIGEEADHARNNGYQLVKQDSQYLYWQRRVTSSNEGSGYCGIAGDPRPPMQSFVASQNIRENRQQNSGSPKTLVSPKGEEIDLELIKKMAGE